MLSIFSRLLVCEKALAEYLETKRLSFPRFYFVSAADLLEIVSKGTQPRQVAHDAMDEYSLDCCQEKLKFGKYSMLCVYMGV